MDIRNFIIEKKSKFDFETTVETINQSALDTSWKVSAIHDMQANMANAGKEVLPAKVLELCKPSISYNILNTDSDRFITALMPCRISIYNKHDGLTYISLFDPNPMKDMLSINAASSMTAAFAEIEILLSKIVD